MGPVLQTIGASSHAKKRVEVEAQTNYPKTVRAPFVVRFATDLISVWMRFPEDRPYRTYSLVTYREDKSAPPRPMAVRYTIDHPYGSLIGWSVVNPEVDNVHECRWTTEQADRHGLHRLSETPEQVRSDALLAT